MELSVDVLQLVKELRAKHENIISNQIGRSATSICANIAESKYAHGRADELVEDDSWQIDGGSFQLITISLENGDKHSIYSGNGFYQSEANHYRVSTLPTILEEKVTRVDFNYGTYNGTQVLMTDVYGSYDDVVLTETIGDLTFTYSSSNRLYAFNNGIKYTLTEAYENELLTYENLQCINSSYCEA